MSSGLLYDFGSYMRDSRPTDHGGILGSAGSIRHRSYLRQDNIGESDLHRSSGNETCSEQRYTSFETSQIDTIFRDSARSEPCRPSEFSFDAEDGAPSYSLHSA